MGKILILLWIFVLFSPASFASENGLRWLLDRGLFRPSELGPIHPIQGIEISTEFGSPFKSKAPETRIWIKIGKKLTASRPDAVGSEADVIHKLIFEATSLHGVSSKVDDPPAVSNSPNEKSAENFSIFINSMIAFLSQGNDGEARIWNNKIGISKTEDDRFVLILTRDFFEGESTHSVTLLSVDLGKFEGETVFECFKKAFGPMMLAKLKKEVTEISQREPQFRLLKNAHIWMLCGHNILDNSPGFNETLVELLTKHPDVRSPEEQELSSINSVNRDRLHLQNTNGCLLEGDLPEISKLE